MIVIKNAKRLDDTIHDVTIESDSNIEIDGNGKLVLLPAIIDTHALLSEWSPDKALKGGITTVFVTPGPIKSFEDFTKKKEEIDQKLSPLRTHFYLEEDALEWFGRVRKKIVGLKTKGQNEDTFRLAAQENVILALDFGNETSRLKTAIDYAEKYKTDMVVQNIKTKEDLDLIRRGKENELFIFAETSFDLLNPESPLWEGISDGTLDGIGSGGKIEELLPFLLNAYHAKKITLDKIVQLTHLNSENMFGLGRNSDAVLVDMDLAKPVYTIVQGKAFPIKED